MISKYSGTCADCGGHFPAGAKINYDRSAPRGCKASHAECPTGFDENRVIEVRTSGGTFYQRAGGRCEDAPCCGCCTF